LHKIHRVDETEIEVLVMMTSIMKLQLRERLGIFSRQQLKRGMSTKATISSANFRAIKRNDQVQVSTQTQIMEVQQVRKATTEKSTTFHQIPMAIAIFIIQILASPMVKATSTPKNQLQTLIKAEMFTIRIATFTILETPQLLVMHSSAIH
jgi:hypothetical protein